MNGNINRRIRNIAIVLSGCVLLSGCRSTAPNVNSQHTSTSSTTGDSSEFAVPAAELIPELEQRVADNPKDFVALNKLSGYYLQRQRETGEDKYIALAAKAAKSSLAVIPAERNAGALAALAQAELASHQFATARDYAEQLIKLEPDKKYPHQILLDALIELGDYKRAEEVFALVKKTSEPGISSETRAAKFEQLHGNTASAKQHIANALAFGVQQVPRSRESVAWCHWQMGELFFSNFQPIPDVGIKGAEISILACSYKPSHSHSQDYTSVIGWVQKGICIWQVSTLIVTYKGCIAMVSGFYRRR